MSPENVPELRQHRRSLLQLWRVLRPPHPSKASDAAKIEPQESETAPLPEVHQSAFLLVYLHSELREFFPQSLFHRFHKPVMTRVGVNQYHQIIRKSYILDVGVFPVACGVDRFLKHPIYLIEIEVAEQR